VEPPRACGLSLGSAVEVVRLHVFDVEVIRPPLLLCCWAWPLILLLWLGFLEGQPQPSCVLYSCCSLLYCGAVDALAETEDCRVYSVVQDTPHTGCRGLHLGAASSPSQLISVTAFVYEVFRAYRGNKGLYSEQCSRSESLHVKGFCF
jgi:hypothetical protein